MLNGGPVMSYFRNWAHDDRNVLCFVGYQAEGTLGRRLQKDSQRSHSDRWSHGDREGRIGHGHHRRILRPFRSTQLMDFVGQMSPTPKNVICHHGDYHKCNELGHSLREKFRVRTWAPKNLETIRLA